MVSKYKDRKKQTSALLGSAFLMATSAIGPGFITQTAVFTEQLFTSFAFVILCSIIIDIIIQLNIWRVISVSGAPAQTLANRVLPGTGHVLSFLIIAGGLAFNIGNMGGAALAFQLLFGLSLPWGALISLSIALSIFWLREIGSALDHFTKILGISMILVTLFLAFSSQPPIKAALIHAMVPEKVDITAIIVLVGGTVGGYISFSGAHRLLAAGIVGEQNVKSVSRNSIKGIFLAGIMRVLLFLAALGVVAQGITLDPANPASTVFSFAGGKAGHYFFGVVLLCASLTSIVGSAFTSFTFIESYHPVFKRHQSIFLSAFLVLSVAVLLFLGKPVKILIVVGALNAFVLPLGLAVILFVARKRTFIGEYEHPIWLWLAGWLVMIALALLSLHSIFNDFM